MDPAGRSSESVQPHQGGWSSIAPAAAACAAGICFTADETWDARPELA